MLVMELGSKSLKDHIYSRSRRIRLDEMLELLLQICRGMRYLHQQGVVHRDLKPGTYIFMIPPLLRSLPHECLLDNVW